ncbi:MAG: hypothetical protein MI975_04945 [Cytophagales bacterium]|nr:hypothetical protein [Cytophagales bacterium]
MHTVKYCVGLKIISPVFIIVGLLFSDAYGNTFSHSDNIPKIDTLNKNISFIFKVSHGGQNLMDLTKSHPVFNAGTDMFLFTTYSELPDGLELSPEGAVSWSPSSEQFLKLKEAPVIIDFNAKNRNDSYVIGQVRVIAQGELKITDSISAPDTAKIEPIVGIESREDEEESPELLPISIITPSSGNWDTRNEGEAFSFEVRATGGSGDYKFELLKPEQLMGSLDPYGNFSWTPDFDVASREEILSSIQLKVKVFDTGGNEAFTTFPIFIRHVNRPPIVNELPTFYIQYNAENVYQLNKTGLAYDPDGDSILFKPVLKELPERMTMNNEGEIRWKPSNKQWNYLSANPIFLSFSVEDYPEGAKTIGQLKIEKSQADLPPEITMIPNKNSFDLKEDQELQLSFFVTDPNGEDDLLSFGFVSENSDLKEEALKKKNNGQYVFNWTPGFDFINVEGEKEEFDISFFAIDKESNRSEKNILVTVEDTEDLVEKDRVLYDQYRTVLERAWDMVSQLNDKEKELEKKYKHAKKGKKNRAISTASLGALTGLSPIIFMENPEGQKVAAGLGGTATATIGTLEASNVIGEPPSDIMRDLNYVSQKRNDLLVYGNVFASKYALPLSKRDRGFQNDLKNLSIHLSLKDAAQLELDASWENSKDATSKNIKKVFKDFNPDPRFENNYKF